MAHRTPLGLNQPISDRLISKPPLEKRRIRKKGAGVFPSLEGDVPGQPCGLVGGCQDTPGPHLGRREGPRAPWASWGSWGPRALPMGAVGPRGRSTRGGLVGGPRGLSPLAPVGGPAPGLDQDDLELHKIGSQLSIWRWILCKVSDRNPGVGSSDDLELHKIGSHLSIWRWILCKVSDRNPGVGSSDDLELHKIGSRLSIWRWILCKGGGRRGGGRVCRVWMEGAPGGVRRPPPLDHTPPPTRRDSSSLALSAGLTPLCQPASSPPPARLSSRHLSPRSPASRATCPS